MIKLFNKLFEVRDISHQIHLSKSDGKIGKHEALEEFYDDLLEQTDLLVEIYQGQYDLVDDFGLSDYVDFSDHIKYFTDFVEMVKEYKKSLKEEDNHMVSILDEIIIITYKLLYKLRHL